MFSVLFDLGFSFLFSTSTDWNSGWNSGWNSDWNSDCLILGVVSTSAWNPDWNSDFHNLDFFFCLFDLGCSFNVATAYQTAAVVNTDVRLRTGAFTLVLYSLFHCCWGVDLGEARVPGKLN